MNVKRLSAIGQSIASLVRDYSNGPDREMLVDPALYAYLSASAGSANRSVSRQYPAHLPNAKRAPRIDFRIGGMNPVLIEFAVRPSAGGGTLYGSQNVSELRKLCRFSNSKAKLRALLLVDLAKDPIDMKRLKATYDGIDAGRGRFHRYPVKIIYAHATVAYSFKWSPFKPG